MRAFTALRDFDSPETKSSYAEGLSYTIRPGNRYLNALAEVWVLEGKIVFHHDGKRTQVQGKGVLTTPPPVPPPVIQWSQVLEPVVVEEPPVPIPATIVVEEVVPPLPEPEPIQDLPPTIKDQTIWEKTKDAWRAWWQ